MVPFQLEGVAISVQKGNPLNIHNTKDLAGKKVAVEAPGYEYDTITAINKQQVAQGLPAMNILTFQLTSESYQALAAGQVDAVVIDDPEVNHYNQTGQFSAAIEGLNPAPLGLGFSSDAVPARGCCWC